MQAWGGLGRRCLFCTYRPAIWQANRTFGSTAVLERSNIPKRKGRIKRLNLGRSHAAQRAIDRNQRLDFVKSPGFAKVVNDALVQVARELQLDGASENAFEMFKQKVKAISAQGFHRREESGSTARMRNTVREGYLEAGEAGLGPAIKTAFRDYAYDVQFSSGLNSQEKLVDFRYPTEWYPAARAIQRRVHLHVGPTNSGKTYQALKRLEEAESGFYAGPLRLLAHEVYARFNAKGKSCGLITGDEVRVDENSPPAIFSNTVEMVPLGKELDVGVIDEIQMIADPSRGWAWTRALLGSRAHELHLCGEERVVPLIRQLLASTGDKLEVHRYERLNPLKAMDTSLKGSFRRLQKGDAVVAFSRITIHALKQQIEQTTGRRAAIVYGSLPAEIRSQQADLFNDPNNDYDFLVASDAIGMGLNLSCKRIIFESVVRKTPYGLERLSISQVKQIGGRAGRYRTAMQQSADQVDSSENVGLVTSLEDIDLPYVRQALNSDPEPILAAGLLPTDHMVQVFANHFPPDVPFGYVMNRLQDLSRTSPGYFLCTGDRDSGVVMSKILDRIEGMTVQDKMVFLKAPLQINDPKMPDVIRALSRCVAEHKSGALLEIPELRLDILDDPVSGDKEYLRSLETLHRSLVLYLWLSFRCGGIFTDRTLATHVKDLVEMKMDRALTEFSANSNLQQASSLRRQIAMLRQMQAREPGTEREGLADADPGDDEGLDGLDKAAPVAEGDSWSHKSRKSVAG